MEGCFAVLLFRVPTCAVSKINFTRDRQKPTLRARSLCYLISYSVNVHGRYMSMYRSTLSLPRAGGSASGTSRNNVLYAPSSPYPCICKNRNALFPPLPRLSPSIHARVSWTALVAALWAASRSASVCAARAKPHGRTPCTGASPCVVQTR